MRDMQQRPSSVRRTVFEVTCRSRESESATDPNHEDGGNHASPSRLISAENAKLINRRNRVDTFRCRLSQHRDSQRTA